MEVRQQAAPTAAPPAWHLQRCLPHSHRHQSSHSAAKARPRGPTPGYCTRLLPFQKRLIAFFNAFMPFLPQIPDPFVLLFPFFTALNTPWTRIHIHTFFNAFYAFLPQNPDPFDVIFPLVQGAFTTVKEILLRVGLLCSSFRNEHHSHDST